MAVIMTSGRWEKADIAVGATSPSPAPGSLLAPKEIRALATGDRRANDEATRTTRREAESITAQCMLEAALEDKSSCHADPVDPGWLASSQPSRSTDDDDNLFLRNG